MTGLHLLGTGEDGSSADTERCPWCGQAISHEKFGEIRERIQAEERKRHLDFERRLRDRVAGEKKQIEADAKARIERARKQAEIAMKPKLATAEKSRKAAERQLEVLKGRHEAAVNKRLEEQRIVLDKDKTDAVNAERAKTFKANLKLEGRVQQLQRQLQNKTADELGEGAEIDLFETLRGRFPQDDISRIGKGKEGADILHKVVDGRRVCGSIVYDSKNRVSWRSLYVSKLRRDQLAAKADHAVLATRVFPVGTRQVHLQDGVIILNAARALVIAELLRGHLVQMYTMRLSNESRQQKMATLYDFIMSDRCNQLLSQVQIQTDDLLEIDVKEKKVHDATWQRRGEVIKSVQRAEAELSSEIDRIVRQPATEQAAQAT
jgi:hypothetical protein